jgi:hypothetical protein
MTDEQFKIIVKLLEEIKSHLCSIDSNTTTIPLVENQIRETVEILKELKYSDFKSSVY